MNTSQQFENLTQLPNIGFVLAKRLMEVGIYAPEELRNIGIENTFLRLQVVDPGACIQELYAIAGAIKGIRSNDLSSEEKAGLKLFFAQAKKEIIVVR